MLSVKRHSYTLFSRLKLGIMEIIKIKNRRKKKSVLFFFNSQEASYLNQKRTKENKKNLLKTTIQINFSVKKGVLKNFMIFTGKRLCQSLSLDKVAWLKPVIYLKRDFCSTQVFSYKLCKVFKNI